MKYEMVFGDKKMFDGAPDDAVIAIKRPFISRVRSEKMYFFSSAYDAILEAGSSFNFNNVIFKTNEYAERRIIKEPKLWTWEDKNGGVLPEIGCRAIWHDDNGMKYAVKIETAFFGNECAVSIDDEAIYFAEKFCLFPIETPAEKATRLENEFVEKMAHSLGISIGATSYQIVKSAIRHTYRELTRGDKVDVIKEGK